MARATVDEAIHDLSNILWKYGYGTISYPAVKQELMNISKSHPQICLQIVRYSQNPWCGYFHPFDGSDKENSNRLLGNAFYLSKNCDVKSVLSTLKQRFYKSMIICPGSGGYDPGFRLLRFKKCGYDDVYRQVCPLQYKQDMKVIRQWEEDSDYPTPTII